jgi:hypothetical protein
MSLLCRSLLFFLRLSTIYCFWIEPQLKLEPVEDIEHTKSKLEETKGKSDKTKTELRIEFSRLIFDIDVIEIRDKDANNDGKIGSNFETIVHILLGDLFLFL